MEKVKIGRFEIDRNLLLFLIATALLGINSAIETSSLANRLHDELSLTVIQRSALEFPRELPGLLGAVVLAAIAAIGDIKSMAIACFVAGAGILSFGLIPSDYILVVITIFVYSLGLHLTMPLNSSVSMSFAKGGKIGKQLGQIQGLSTAMVIISSGALFLLYKFLHMPVWVSFIIGAVVFFIAGILFLKIKLPKEQITRSKFVFRKEYSLFYILSLINGARKQLTITFVPWLIIDVFQKDVSTITLLFFIVSLMNVFFKPFLGKLIDQVGERFILMGEAIALIFVSLGFAFGKTIFPGDMAFYFVCLCYIVDNLLISVSMARSTYMRRIAKTPEDVSPSLAMGMSCDHVIATTLPFVAGLIWYNLGSNGYIYVFLGGTVISVLNLLAASRIRLKHTPPNDGPEVTEKEIESVGAAQ